MAATPANSENIQSAGLVKFDGVSAFTGVTTTQHAVLIGATSNGITNLAAGTTGQVLQTNTSADPTWSTATYPSTTTANQLLYSSATNTVGGLTSANSTLAATNASGTLAMRAFSVVIQEFAASGTYTPTTGMLYCIIECKGAGAGGGGSASTTAAQLATGGGGGSGEYARGVFSASTIGASQTVTIGAGGAGGTAGANNGSVGGNTSVGALITAVGGNGGIGSAASTTSGTSLGGSGGTGGTGGTFHAAGGAGGDAIFIFGSFQYNGRGAPGLFGSQGITQNATGTGIVGAIFGGGGSGGFSFISAAAQAGGAGAAGVVIITEYVIN